MQRSKVIALPTELKEQLDRKLVEGSFSGYKGLETWLGEQGFQISHSSLQRYGSQFEKRLAAVSRATQQVKALSDAAPDQQAALSDGLTKLIQTRLFDVLVESEEISDATLARFGRVIATLGRATVTQKRWREEVREKLEEQKRVAGLKMEEIKHAGGLSPEAYDTMRALLLGIDPTKESGISRHVG